jgi:FAD/FMN-containing dehydrogenase
VSPARGPSRWVAAGTCDADVWAAKSAVQPYQVDQAAHTPPILTHPHIYHTGHAVTAATHRLPLVVPVPPEVAPPAGESHAPRAICRPSTDSTTNSTAPAWTCRNWAGTVEWSPSEVVAPASEAELSSYLAATGAAGAAAGPLKVVGFAHSWAGLYLPAPAGAAGAAGATLALHALSGIARLDAEAGTVEVLAGTSFASLFADLAAAGLALPFSPGGIQGLTVGGAVSVGFHGSQLSLGGVSSAVSALRVYDTATGARHDLSGAADPEAMRAARMGLGMCGVLSRVTLPVVPQFHLRRRRWRVDDAGAFLGAQLPGLKRDYDRFHYYVHPATGSAWPMTWEPATAEESAAEARPCRTALEQAEDAGMKEFGADGLPLIMRWDNCSDVSYKSLTHAVDMDAQPLWNGGCCLCFLGCLGGGVNLVRGGTFSEPPTLCPHRAKPTLSHPHPRTDAAGELYVSFDDDAAEAAAVRAILDRFAAVAAVAADRATAAAASATATITNAAAPNPDVWLHVRYVGGDTASLLNPCYGARACAAVELALVAPAMDAPLPPWDEWAAYMHAMEDVLAPLGGRPHWAKYSSRRENLFPAPGLGLPVAEFRAACSKFDPAGRLRSTAFESVLGATRGGGGEFASAPPPASAPAPAGEELQVPKVFGAAACATPATFYAGMQA